MPNLIPLTCPSCSGQLQVIPGDHPIKCKYCGNEFLLSGNDPAKKTNQMGSIIFHRQSEPREGAFTLQVPDGWMTEGGIFRTDPMQAMLNAQAIEAKLDFIVKRDLQGSVALRWCPEMKYTDPKMNLGAGLSGLLGGKYSGMSVTPLLQPVDFILKIVFPWAHPQATNVQVIHEQDLPILAENYRKRMASLGLPCLGSYAGGMVVFNYTEGNLTFQENAYCVIENMGPIAGGMWSNKDTLIERALAAEINQWQPIMAHIRDTGQINPAWLAQEMRNQGMMANSFLDAQRQQQAREQQMLNVQHDLQNMDRQIADHRSQTNAQIQKDQYLNLMNLEEYYNPYTREPEYGSNQWQYRWISESGDEYYCDDVYNDPNSTSFGNRSDWKLTPIKQRPE